MNKIKLESTAAFVMLWALKLYNQGAEVSEKLRILPREIEFPSHVKFKIRYDASQKLLIYKGVMSEKEKEELLSLSQEVTYRKAVEVLFQRSYIIPKFINKLDLSSGKDLNYKCNALWSRSEEVILNRKYFIRHLIEQQINSNGGECQLVFLAAGKSPLSLEILVKYFSKVYRIFELDLDGMDEKQTLYSSISPEFADKLKCITADIASPDIVDILNKQENDFRHDVSTIILMEGISYYISKQVMKVVLANFLSKEKNNVFIIEYLVPYQCVNRERRVIAKETFSIIKEYTGLSRIHHYTKDELLSFFREKGGDLVENYSMKDMEFARTSTNTYFKNPSDGWIECCVGKI